MMSDPDLTDELLNTSKFQGQRLVDLRKQTHLSRRAFALKHAISPGSLQNWESGRYQGLTKIAIDKLLLAFRKEGIDCSIEWLLYGKPPKPVNIRETAPYSITDNLPKKEQLSDTEILQLTVANAEKYKINRQLYEATIAGRYAEVVRLIHEVGSNLHLMSGVAVYLFDIDENTLLHIASKNGNLNIVKFLIENGTEVDVRNRKKQTPLHWASHNGHCEIVDYLVKKGTSVDIVDNEGGTPLSWAAYGGQVEIAKQLITFGANINSCDQFSNTSLHWACYNNRLDVVKFLVKMNAFLNKKNSTGYTPLQLAVENGHIETVKFLLDYQKQHF